MTFSAIIVDDEFYVRLGLKNRINWESNNVQIVGEASDANQALSLIVQKIPDIVITDIKMPGMDGLELIRRAKEINPSLAFVILSGYGNFAYAKQAIRLGVHEFIEKPIDDIEMNKALRHIVSDLQSHKLATSSVSESIIQRNERLLHIFLHGGNEIFSAATLPVWNISLLQLSSTNNVLDRPLPPLCEMLENRLNSSCGKTKWYVFPVNTELQLLSVAADISQNQEQSLISFSKTIHTTLRTLGLDFDHIYASYITTSHFGNNYFILLNFLKNRLFFPETQDWFPTQIEQPNFFISSQLFDNVRILRNLINTQKRESFHRELSRVIPDDGKGLNVFTLEWLLCELRAELVALSSVFLLLEPPNLLNELTQPEFLLYFSSFDALRSHLWTVASQVFEKIQPPTPNENDVIHQLEDYIQVHYNESLSLNELGTQFYINPVYLSSLFKKKRGLKLSQYIENVRLEHAKHLLVNTALSIGEISLAVGYSDTNYFGKVFRKSTGFSPLEFRRYNNNDT